MVLDTDVTSGLRIEIGTNSMYRIQGFAKLAGVTVRALHHYDRLGLLKPSQRDANGYRMYTNVDLTRLEQISVLKYLGLSLKEISKVLTDDPELREVFGRQRLVLLRKRRQLDRVICAIETADHAFRTQRQPEWNLFANIIKEIEMEQDWAKQYYSEEGQAKVEARKHLWSPELQADVSAKWAQLFAEVEAALNEDPAGEHGQQLAARWKELVAGFTDGDPEIQKGLNKMYSDQGNWPEQQRQSFAIRPEIQDWIVRAMGEAPEASSKPLAIATVRVQSH